MTRALLAAAMALPLCLSVTAPVSAQQPAGPTVARPARGSGPVDPGGLQPGGADVFMSIKEYPSNQQSGVNADQFIGYPDRATAAAFNGMRLQSMLRAGDPYHPGVYGSVLEYRDQLAVVTLWPHGESTSVEAPGIYFYYVQGGAGRVDTGPGTKSYDLHAGVGVLFAPGAKQHFVNAGDTPPSMIMLTWKNNDGLRVKQDLKVVDTNTEPLNPGGVHWVMSGKSMFNGADGINASASAIVVPAGTYTGPHAHGRGGEEIWVKTGFDVGYAILGSDIRKIDGPGAFLAPPNGLTTHSSMNLTDHDEIWLYLARSRNPPAAAPAATGNRPPAAPR